MNLLEAIKSSPIYRGILEDGATMAAHRMLRKLGQKRFGPIPLKSELGLRCIEDIDRLDHLLDTVDEAKSWDDWLQSCLVEVNPPPAK